MHRSNDKVSYLQAKDQTIQIFSRTNLNNCRVNLVNEMEDNTTPEVTSDETIPVYLRIKGGNIDMELYEINGNSISYKVPEESCSFRNLKSGDTMCRIYKFSQIFGPNTRQIEIFNCIVKRNILDFINGKNATLLTYGTTGSGKTFTIVGTPAEPGIIPRALEYMFKTIPTLAKYPVASPLPNGDIVFLTEEQMELETKKTSGILKTLHNDRYAHSKTYRQMQQRLSSEPVAEIEDFSNVSVSIWVSFAEIYNENIYDLLQPLPKNRIRPKLKLGHSNEQIYIKDISSVCVRDGLEAYQVHQYGIQTLNYAATALNSHSSRSHSIFTIKLVQTSKIDGGTKMNYLHFCDLAGSERSKKTLNIGERLKESNNINKSLLVLGRCIEGVRTLQQSKDNHQLVPFRESKLTRLFQYALLGQENIALIVNLNPSKSMFEESHHALNFSAIAKDIIIEEKPETETKLQNKENEQKDEEIERLQNLVSDLYNEIENMKTTYESEILVEKHSVADMYKKYIQDIKRRHEEELVSEVKRKTEYLEAQNERLNKLVNEDVINISSSSSENSFSRSFYENENQDLQQQCVLLNNEIQELKNSNISLQLEKDSLLKTIERMKRRTLQDSKEQDLIRQLEYDKKVNEMKIAMSDLEKENKIYKAELKKLVLQNIKLKDVNEELSVISFATRNGDSDEEETQFSGLASSTQLVGDTSKQLLG